MVWLAAGVGDVWARFGADDGFGFPKWDFEGEEVDAVDERLRPSMIGKDCCRCSVIRAKDWAPHDFKGLDDWIPITLFFAMYVHIMNSIEAFVRRCVWVPLVDVFLIGLPLVQSIEV